MTAGHTDENEEGRGKDDLRALADKKKKKKLQQLAEDQSRTKVDTWKSTTNR